MAVQLGVEIARGVVAEGGGDDLLTADADHLPGLPVLHPGLGRVLLDPAEGCLHRAVVSLDNARHRRRPAPRGKRISGAEKVRSRPGRWAISPSLPRLPEMLPGAVGHLAFQHRPEHLGIDRAVQPEFFRPLAGPGAGGAVLGIVLCIIAVAFVVRSLPARPRRARRSRACQCQSRRRWRRRIAGTTLRPGSPGRHGRSSGLFGTRIRSFRRTGLPSGRQFLRRRNFDIACRVIRRSSRHARRCRRPEFQFTVPVESVRPASQSTGFGGTAVSYRTDPARHRRIALLRRGFLRGAPRTAPPPAGRFTYLSLIEATGKGPGNLR